MRKFGDFPTRGARRRGKLKLALAEKSTSCFPLLVFSGSDDRAIKQERKKILFSVGWPEMTLFLSFLSHLQLGTKWVRAGGIHNSLSPSDGDTKIGFWGLEGDV